ncbi:family 2 glycosyl transferase [Aureobasidium pullulans]|uniref:Family 2 glycosyl transferase n=1 Tax=Aureobasidium pullulans TaxID=5580 RepID=A0A4S8VHZ6_AURPU|nr:family 2 glycosyl transferase [Aureobasidium pullulans]THW78289.1 family 2 glycosyl transferase [Aureobasidium pullulans]THX96948.1 family 2 glycosyl transferase [Aureobasidium pullulans]THZ23992.1 family 2 glycosyl transferase [Aureobasidium pullulans]
MATTELPQDRLFLDIKGRDVTSPALSDFSLPKCSSHDSIDGSYFDSSPPGSGISTPASSYPQTPSDFPIRSKSRSGPDNIVVHEDSNGSLDSINEDMGQDVTIKRPLHVYLRPSAKNDLVLLKQRPVLVSRDRPDAHDSFIQPQSSSPGLDESSTASTEDLDSAHIPAETDQVSVVRHEAPGSSNQDFQETVGMVDVIPEKPTRAAPQAPIYDTIEVAEAEPERGLILPSALPLPAFPNGARDPEKEAYDIEEQAQSHAARVCDPEKQEHDVRSSPAFQEESSVWTRLRDSYYRTYCPKVEPTLLLPTGPTDVEKYSYLKTNRLGLYVFGVISFLSLSAGMWLFVISSVIFSWFGVFFGLLQIYLMISYGVSLCGKDFDFENHKKILEEHPIEPETCPTVDIYLPCCKEPLEILENTYKHVQRLQWPEGKLKVYVMDDGAMDSVKELAESHGFTYMCRDDRPRLKKAGNLRWTFARTSGDFFNIYDADFCPRSDFLLETIPHHLADDKLCIVQTPQFFRVSDEQTWVEQGASAVQELFYRVVQVNRNRWGASICVGSNAVYRRAALEEVGGTAEIGFSEDVHTGFGAVDRGWKVTYVPINLACGICPDNPRAFFSQQMRWCMGSTTLLTNPEFWTSSLNLTQKVCYLCGMMYYSAMALSIFISPVPGIFLLWFRPEFFKYYNLAFAVPSLIYGLLTFRMWAKASYGMNVQYIMVIQSYAYLNAIKDRLLGNGLAWAPSGDNKSHKNNKYRNMRILCTFWTIIVTGFMVGGCTYRILLGMHFYNCIPLLLLHAFNLLLAHRFLLWSG